MFFSENEEEEFNMCSTHTNGLKNKVDILTSLLKASDDIDSVTEVEIKKLKNMVTVVACFCWESKCPMYIP